MSKIKNPANLLSFLADGSKPLAQRRLLARGFIKEADDDDLDRFLAQLSTGAESAVQAEAAVNYARLLAELEEGPYRPATFVAPLPDHGPSSRLAEVILDDGTSAMVHVTSEQLLDSLQPGDRVVLDKQARGLLRCGPAALRLGDVATFERRVFDGYVEVSLRAEGRAVILASRSLLDKIAAGDVLPGASLVVSARHTLAIDVIPPADGLSHYRYLRNSPVPDVVVERDIGAPHRVIKDLISLLRLEMTHPEIRRAFRLRRLITKLFTGVPGTGKTLAIHAIWRLMYEVMAEVTSTPIDQLPPRVFSLSCSDVLDPYLGVSDKNLARFFNEVEHLAAEPWTAPDGRTFRLPVLVVLEEVDGLAAQRGGFDSGVYDRILTTILQRLDPIRPELKDQLVICIATTNEIQRLDAGFLRRIGGSIVVFKRLKRRSFTAVLRKHLAGRPLVHDGAATPEEAERALVAELTAWLYSANGSDPGIVELTYMGSSKPEVRHRRDFLNGALVDRAVQDACGLAAQAEAEGAAGCHGLTLELVAVSLDHQIRGIVDQLSEHNVGRYLDIPDGARVASVRRLPQPEVAPFLLQIH